MKQRYKRHGIMFEDDNEGMENQEATQQNNNEIQALNQKIMSLVNQRNQIKNDSNTKIMNIDKQIILLMDQVAKAGGNVNPNLVKENKKTRGVSFSKKLYESATQMTNTAEMREIIAMTFEDADMSYIPNETECNTHARNIISFINRIEFRRMDGDERIDELEEYMKERLERSKYAFGKKEIERFAEKFVEALERNSMFQWIFD